MISQILTAMKSFNNFDYFDNFDNNDKFWHFFTIWPIFAASDFLLTKRHFRQLRTSNHDNHSDLTIRSETVQHSQFLQCFVSLFGIEVKHLRSVSNHRKNCECCPVSLLIVRQQRLSWIQVLNCQNCNQYLKCHRSLRLLLKGVLWGRWICR